MTVEDAPMYTVAVIDDHEIVRNGHRTGFEQHGLDCKFITESVAEFRRLGVDSEDCDLVVLDLAIPGEDSTDNVRSLVKDGFTVVVLTSHYEPFPLAQAVDAGAKALIAKDDPMSVQIEYMLAVCRGDEEHFALTKFMANVYLDGPIHVAPSHLQVLRLYVGGMRAREVAAECHLTLNTVNSYVKTIRQAYRDRDPTLPTPLNREALRRLAEDDGFI